MCLVWESTNRKWGRNLNHDITPSREPAPLLYFSRSKTDIYMSKLKLFAKIGIISIPFNTLSRTLSTIFSENTGFVLTFVWFFEEAVPLAQPSVHGWWRVGIPLLWVQETIQELDYFKKSHQEGNPALELLKGERKKIFFCYPGKSACAHQGAIQRGSPSKAENLISYFHSVLLRVLFSLPAWC